MTENKMEIVAGKCPIEAGGNCPLRPQGEWIKAQGEQVLQIARHCESISKRGGDHAGEYYKIAQHLKKSAGHLLALERNGKT